jgi:hypothetical protein
MKKALLSALVVLFVATAGAFADTAMAGRSWTYLNGTALISPHWAFMVMPGLRGEFNRNGSTAKDTYLYELFTGPVYIARKGAVTFKLPLWYYYMGYPNKAADTYAFSHNFEVVPTVEYRYKNWTFIDRVILHNTFYASVYSTEKERSGYGLVLRELVQANYSVNKNLTLILADEPFFGVIEDKDTTVAANGGGAGYWGKGFRLNRVYAGFNYAFSPSLSISPQYVFETTYDTRGKQTEIDHYVYLTLSYAWKLYK